MQKKFVLNLILLVFLNLMIKPFYILGIDTEILERVGQQEYGLYFALLNLSFLLNIFLDLGIVNFNTNYIAKHHHLVSKHFTKIIGLRFLLTIFYLIICLLVGLILGYDSFDFTLLIPICINQVLAGFILYFRSSLSGLQLFVKDSLISVLDRLILIGCCSLILWGNVFDTKISISLFIYLQMMAYGVTAIAAYLSIGSRLERIRPTLNLGFSIIVLKKSLPYAVLILLMNFYYRTDGIMLERMLDDGAYEAGIYAQAFRFFEAGNMFAYLFAALLYPMFSKLIGQERNVETLMKLSFRIMLVFSVTGGVAGYFFSSEIMDFRFSSEIENASAAFKYLMIAFVGVSGTYIFGSLLTANGNLRELNIMAISGAVFNIALNLVLIPKYRAEGAAMASMVTQIGMTIGQMILVKRKTGATLGMNLIIRSLIFISLSITSILFLRTYFSQWMICALAFFLSSVILSLVLNIVSVKSFIQYIRFSSELKS